MPLIDQLESLLGAFANQVDAFSRDGRRVIIGCALMAGLSSPTAVFGLLRISVFSRINPPSSGKIGLAFLICLSCYLAAAGLLLLCRTHRLTSVSWIFVTALGSFFLACVLVSRFGAKNLWAMTFGFSLFTLPFSAMVKFAGHLVRAITRWHDGRDFLVLTSLK